MITPAEAAPNPWQTRWTRFFHCSLVAILLILASPRAFAATNMEPVAVTGWNADVVIEASAVGPPFTGAATEINAGAGAAYYQTGLPGYAWGMPPSGAFVSLTGDRTIFQFQPYTTNNALILSTDTGLTNGTLTLSQPGLFSVLGILANSANGTNQTGSLTLNFTDGTSFKTTFYAPDWYNGTSQVAWFGPGSVNLTSGADTGGPENPCFYETTLNLQALLGATNKPLASLTFGKTVAKSTLIYAISGLPIGLTPPVGTPIAASGWNRDMVIENTASGPPYTNVAGEFHPGEGTAYYQMGLPGTTYGLPRTGAFASAVDGTLFQLQPYNRNNALVMSSETALTQGILTLSNAAVYNSLTVLANSANGGGTPTMTVNFADGSTLVTNINAQDWFTGTQNIALQGFDRINLLTGVADGGPVDPQFYQTTFDLTALFGPANKPIVSIIFNQAPTASATAIYALSGVAGNQTNGFYSPAIITNLGAPSVSTRSATLNGTISATGGAVPEVFLYYGTTDGGTNASVWGSTIFLGPVTGGFSQNLSGLIPGTTYYFRAVAINAAGVAWAPVSQNFSTATASTASVVNGPAENITPGAAILAGNILTTGGDAPTVTFYYGPANGGTSASAWAQSLTLPGNQAGVFAAAVSGLTPNTTYYFSAQASNAAGVSWGASVQSFVTLASNVPPSNLFAVLTGRDDNGRTGADTNESILTLANVNSNTFGKLFSQPLDGTMVAQPLVLPNVAIPGHGIHNLLFAATENDSVYAFDADSAVGPNAQPIWHASFINPTAGIFPLQTTIDLQASTSPSYFGSEIGISGTPVIDPVTGTIYAVAATKEITAGVTNFVFRLHALDVVTGAEKFGGPVVVEGSVIGVGDGFAAGNVIDFVPLKHMNRPALLLQNGLVTVTFTSHQDFPPYHGWVFTYNAYTLQPAGILNTTPNGSAGGLWQASSGPAADAAGNVYFETGNGTFDAANQNFGDSVMKLSTTNGLTLADYFTPYNQLALNLQDLDIGSAGLMLLPDSAGSPAHPHLLVAGSKSGVFWLLDRDNLGQFNAGGDSQIVQEISGQTKGMWVTPAYFNGHIYYCAAGDNAKEFAISNAVITPTPVSVSTGTIGYPGASLSVSANGVNNAIVWGLQTSANQSGPAVLHAYNATNLAVELYNSSQNAARDNPGLAVKYTMPTIANGKVYVGTVNYLTAFGNLSFLPAPVITPPGGIITNSLSIAITCASNTAAIYYTLDGSVPTTNSILYTGPFSLTNSGTVLAMATLPGQANSTIASATFTSISFLEPYDAAVVADGPLGYWLLNETNGSVAYDIVGSHNGSYVGGVTLGQAGVPAAGFGSSSDSALFDGLSAYVDIPEGPFNLTGAVTVTAWVNAPAASHFSGIVGHGDSSWRTSVNPLGEPGAADGSKPDATSSHSLAGTGWHLITYTYSGASGVTNNGTLYVDGLFVTNNTVATPAGNALDVWIGGAPDYGAQRLFSGYISHAAVFAKALSGPQISALYNASLTFPVVTLAITPAAGGGQTLTWSQGKLLQAPSLTGPWTTNTATSPFAVAPTNAQMFFKIQVN